MSTLQETLDKAPDKSNKDAFERLNKLNDRFMHARFHLRPDGKTSINEQQWMSNPCISLVPTGKNVWDRIAVMYGEDVVCGVDGIPTWNGVIEMVEKHIGKKIRYY